MIKGGEVRVEVALFFTDGRWSRSDRTQHWVHPVIRALRRVVSLRPDAGEGKRPDWNGGESGRADITRGEGQRGSNLKLRPVACERTHPIADFPLWMLIGVDRTPRARALGLAEARQVLACRQRGRAGADARVLRPVAN